MGKSYGLGKKESNRLSVRQGHFSFAALLSAAAQSQLREALPFLLGRHLGPAGDFWHGAQTARTITATVTGADFHAGRGDFGGFADIFCRYWYTRRICPSVTRWQITLTQGEGMPGNFEIQTPKSRENSRFNAQGVFVRLLRSWHCRLPVGDTGRQLLATCFRGCMLG
jgi:hypothetical protein